MTCLNRPFSMPIVCSIRTLSLESIIWNCRLALGSGPRYGSTTLGVDLYAEPPKRYSLHLKYIFVDIGRCRVLKTLASWAPLSRVVWKSRIYCWSSAYLSCGDYKSRLLDLVERVSLQRGMSAQPTIPIQSLQSAHSCPSSSFLILIPIRILCSSDSHRTISCHWSLGL